MRPPKGVQNPPDALLKIQGAKMYTSNPEGRILRYAFNYRRG